MWLAIQSSEALVILVTTLHVSCLEYYSMEALAEHALALRHQLDYSSVTCG